jgi:hypothetical protein
MEGVLVRLAALIDVPMRENKCVFDANRLKHQTKTYAEVALIASKARAAALKYTMIFSVDI